jgi:hypothetical protein
LDMGHTGKCDLDRAIKARLLRPLLQIGLMGPLGLTNPVSPKGPISPSLKGKQDVDGCGDTFVAMVLRSDYRPVRKYDSSIADHSPGGAGILRRHKQVKSNRPERESR